jgi:hypothetical protein
LRVAISFAANRQPVGAIHESPAFHDVQNGYVQPVGGDLRTPRIRDLQKSTHLLKNDRIKIIQKFLKEREETFPKKFPRTSPERR